jgi:hypothetical protein
VEKNPAAKRGTTLSFFIWIISILGACFLTFPLIQRTVVMMLGSPVQGTVIGVSGLQYAKAPWVGKFRTIQINRGGLLFEVIVGSKGEELPKKGDLLGMHLLSTQSCWLSNERSTRSVLWFAFLVGVGGYTARCNDSGSGGFATSDRAFGLTTQCLLFLLFAAIILAVIALFHFSARQREKWVIENGAPVKGLVESVQWTHLRTNSLTVSFQWQNETKRKRLTNASKEIQKGQNVTVLVNPNTPKEAFLYPSYQFRVVSNKSEV